MVVTLAHRDVTKQTDAQITKNFQCKLSVRGYVLMHELAVGSGVLPKRVRILFTTECGVRRIGLLRGYGVSQH